MDIKWYYLIMFPVIVEAATELWFEAAPVQWLRNLLRRFTPFLHSKKYRKHLVDCAYCMSFWISFVVSASMFLPEGQWLQFLVVGLYSHRTANYIHLVFALMLDKRRDLLIERG